MQDFSVLNIFLLVLGCSLAGFITTLTGSGPFSKKNVTAGASLSAVLLLVK